MAGKADIEAARAYVTLLMKDQGFSKGMDAAGKRLKSVGKGISIFGAAVAGLGASITGPMLAAVHSVVEYGSSMKLMSERTGQSVEALSALRFAAEQSGATIEDVEKAILMSAKKGYDPKKFVEYAAGLASIEDPGKRAEKAFMMFGKGAGAILPMLERLPQLLQEAKDNGLIMSTATATAAHTLHNSWNLLGRVIGGVKNAIGAALIPIMQEATDWTIRIAKSVRDWVKNNTELFVSVFKIGLVLSVAGTAIAALGGFVASAGFAIIGLNAALGMAVGLFGAIVSPLGLIVSGLSGLAYWFATSTKWGRQMVQSLAGWFDNLKDIAIETFKGIADALSAGDLMLAAKIAWQGVKVAFLETTEGIRVEWVSVGNDIINVMKTVAVAVEGAWAGIAYSMKAVWASLVAESKTIGEEIGHALSRQTIDSVPELERQIAAIKKSMAENTGDSATQFAAQSTLTGLEARLKTAKILGEKGQRELQEDQDRAHNQELGRIKQEHDAQQDKIAAELDAKLAALKKVSLAGGSSSADVAAAQSAAKDAQAKLDALRAQAAKEHKDHDLKGAPAFDPADAALSPTKIQDRVLGSFSAGGLIAAGRGASPGVEELKDIRKEARKAAGVRQQQLIAAQQLRWAIASFGRLQ